MNRRHFLSATSCFLASQALRAQEKSPPHIATNTYPWGTFAKREGKPFVLHSDEALAAIAASGVKGYEASFLKPEEFDGLGPRLKAHGLEMRSLYVNSTLHEESSAAASLREVLEIARRAADLGARFVVTNPSPIRWGGPENKTDEQLLTQAEALNTLGKELHKIGLTLAYHNHDIELRNGAREFHHMLASTDPEVVRFCLDAHWVYRGCGHSQVALFDVLDLYGSRVVELHLRQSRGGVWSEVFTADGDIDYKRLADWFARHGMKPLLTLEQAVEKGSPETMDGISAHKLGVENVRRAFEALA